MYTFVFIATLEDELPKGVLRRCAQITRRWMPSLDVELAEGYTILPELNGGWFWLAPACAGKYSLISEVVEERYAVLVFGDVFGSDPCNAAQLIFDAWSSGGPTRVRELEGSFSAVIVDRSDNSVVLIGDLIGRQALSYYAGGRTLIVSPHDVALMATGRCPVEFDYVSACSVASIDWSLRGRSLLKQVHTCHPDEYIRWFDGRIQPIADPVLDPDQRIAEGDSLAVSQNLDNMIKTAQANTRLFVANKDEIKCDLSAGYDTRAVFSLLLSVVNHPSQIIAQSSGGANSLDVRVARRLARMYSTRFEHDDPIPPTPNDFVAHLDLLAFFMNGGTEGIRAIWPLPSFECNPKTYACGAGGEIFRGFFYPHKPFYPQMHLSPTDALRRMRNWSRIDRLPWRSPEYANAVVTRLNAVVDGYGALSTNAYDILDMFYFYERYSVWGAAHVRQTWKNPRWSPFFSSKLIKLAYMMPAPIGKYATIHRESLHRFASRAYWLRINGIRLAPLEGDRFITSLFRKIDQRYQRYKRKYQSYQKRLLRDIRALNLIQPLSKKMNTQQYKANALGGPLKETVAEICLSKESFALEIFGRHGVESMLNESGSQKWLYLKTLGYLAAMERWSAIVCGVAREATKATSNISSEE